MAVSAVTIRQRAYTSRVILCFSWAQVKLSKATRYATLLFIPMTSNDCTYLETNTRNPLKRDYNLLVTCTLKRQYVYSQALWDSRKVHKTRPHLIILGALILTPFSPIRQKRPFLLECYGPSLSQLLSPEYTRYEVVLQLPWQDL